MKYDIRDPNVAMKLSQAGIELDCLSRGVSTDYDAVNTVAMMLTDFDKNDLTSVVALYRTLTAYAPDKELRTTEQVLSQLEVVAEQLARAKELPTDHAASLRDFCVLLCNTTMSEQSRHVFMSRYASGRI
jgi:hypothetical protein